MKLISVISDARIAGINQSINYILALDGDHIFTTAFFHTFRSATVPSL